MKLLSQALLEFIHNPREKLSAKDFSGRVLLTLIPRRNQVSLRVIEIRSPSCGKA